MIKAFKQRFKKWVPLLNKYSLIFHGILACGLILLIETFSRHSAVAAASFFVHSPLTFLYNALLIFASLLLAFLFKRRMLIRICISIFWLILGITNGIILAARVTPFNFTDFKLIRDLVAMQSSKYVTTSEKILIIVFLAIVGLFVAFLAIRGPKFKGRIKRFRNLVALAACLVAIPFVTKAAIHNNILAGYFGNLAQGYRDYGFVYSFSASVVDTGMSKPDGYRQASINNIVENSKESGSEISSPDAPNIIFVQLETFIDPYEVKFLELSEDPIPNFRSLTENYSTGYITVPVVGAGTANTEFEILTGMSIQYFGLGEYPYKTIMRDQNVESIADALAPLGYSSHALHNNGGNFYGRANVFNEMGFDSFTCKELMNITKYNEIASWPTDDILLEETRKALDSTPDQSDFVYTITVQSHGSYPSEPVFEDPFVEVSGAATQEENYQWEYFVNELYEVDAFIGDLIADLEARDEKTLVVMYGDHLPTMGLTDDDMNNGDIFKTTYATWNNFGLEKEDIDLYAYQILPYYLDQLGIHEGTVMTYHQAQMEQGTTDQSDYLKNLELLQYDLLYGKQYAYAANGRTLNREIPMDMGVQDVILSGISEELTEESDTPDELPPQELLDSVQTGVTHGRENNDLIVENALDVTEDENADDNAAENDDTEITDNPDDAAEDETEPEDLAEEDSDSEDDASEEDDSGIQIWVTGENFTPWSRVYVNDERISTTYISDTLLEVSASDLHDGDSLVVKQLGSSDTVFRSSNTFVITSLADFSGYLTNTESASRRIPVQDRSE